MVKLFPPKKDFNKNMRETAKPRNHVFLSFSSRLRFFFIFGFLGVKWSLVVWKPFFSTAPRHQKSISSLLYLQSWDDATSLVGPENGFW